MVHCIDHVAQGRNKFPAQVLNGRFMDTGLDMVYERGIVGSVTLTQLA